jgi:hypothetical protein
MELTRKDKTFLLKNFPKMELCYEKKVYNTVQNADIYLTIPKGLKYFIWFRSFKKKNCCMLLQLGKNKKTIANIQIYNCCFNSILCSGKGTIFYGTLIKLNTLFFNIEDIFYFKGYDISHFNNIQKLNQTFVILDKYIKQTAYSDNYVILGMPIISTNYDDLNKQIDGLNYDVYAIQNRKIHSNTYYNEYLNKTTESIKTFLIKPTINTDIYQMYYLNNNKEEKHTMALINTYKLSVFMNSLFRNIRENDNLDLIEESDDEEDFENTNLDKNVYLEKKYKFKCVYNKKYKLWQPLEISNENIATQRDINFIEKK